MRLRNEQQLKVRQPLSTLYVCCDSETANKIGVFEKIILDELNIKNIKYIDDVNVLEDKYLTVNFKVAGAVLKQNVNKMKQTLGTLSKDDMTKLVSAVEQGDEVSVPGWDDKFAADIFSVQTKTKEGIVSAELQNDKGVVALDTVLTDELIKEGLVRDTVRQCQLIRKEAGYEVEQRVKWQLSLLTQPLLVLSKKRPNTLSRSFLPMNLSSAELFLTRILPKK